MRTVERPAYTAVLTAHYHAGPWSLRAQQRYYDSTLFNSTWTEGVDVDDNSISSQSLTSLGLSYGQVMNSGGEWRLAFNVMNLFDREAPVIPGQVLANGHDQYGRRFQLGLTLDY
ncbi:MAG TPA: TonB-dependent receptor [Pseudomonadaceae bacterium]|nr:TonB-dependent receptor [Pseudomonadaceae bacterium]